MRSILLLCIFLSFTISSLAQKKKFLASLKDQKTFDLAEDLYFDGKYPFALKQYKKLEAGTPEEPILLFRIGACLLYEKGNKEKAYEYLSKVNKSKFAKSDFVYRLAQTQHLIGKYDEAIANANEALTKKLEPKKLDEVRLLLKHIENAKIAPSNPYTLTNLGSNINTSADEFCPVVNTDMNYLLYAYTGEKSTGGLQAQPGEANADGMYFSDIYKSQLNNNQWIKGRVYDSLLTTNGSEYPLAISYNGMKMLSGKQESFVNHSISQNKKDSASWLIQGELMGLINAPGYEGGASWFKDGSKIVFSSDRLGGFGGKDLYVATLMEDSTWGNIKNLGQGINSPNDEDFPHMHIDGKTLHYSSNGPQSIGGFDIFSAVYSPEEDTWGDRKNLGTPINSNHDEWQFQLANNGKAAFLASGRPGGEGGSDIYMVSGLNYKGDEEYEKRQAELLAKKQKAFEDSVSMAKAKALEAEQAAISAKTTNQDLAKEKAVAKAEAAKLAKEQAAADKAAKAEAAKLAREQAAADKEAKRLERIAQQEAAKMAKEELAAEKAKASTSSSASGWDWSKYDLSSEAAIAAEFGDINTENLVYKVQIASGTLPSNISEATNTELGQIEEIKFKGSNKYVIDKAFNSINEAFQLKNKAIEKGIGDAFITAFYNGKRYYLIDLVKKGILRK
jgi:hypothetical protein